MNLVVLVRLSISTLLDELFDLSLGRTQLLPVQGVCSSSILCVFNQWA